MAITGRIVVLALSCALMLFVRPPREAGVDGAPELQPSRIILGFDGDPATSLAVAWRTSGAVPAPVAQIVPDGPEPIVDSAAKTANASSARVALDGGGAAFHHHARFQGLSPATRYVYRVGDGRVWSEWYAVVTAARTPEPYRFLYIGDSQAGLDGAWPRTVRAGYAQAPDARFIVEAGDIVAEGYDDNLWRQWSAGLGFIAASVPSLPVPGNHDGHRPPTAADADKVLQPSELWRAHFPLPGNGPASLGDLGRPFYYVDYQGVRFIAIDSNPFANSDYVESMRAPVQAAVLAWLRTVLSNNPNRWTVVVQHQPVYAVAKGRDYVQMRAALLPLYDEFHVDLVLQGHDHAYARSHALKGGRVAGPGEQGTVYVISDSGTKMYAVDTPHAALMAKIIEQVQLYQIVAVDRNTLTLDSYTANGRRVDQFQLKKP
jgi:3',5'-cyclic AMP phosphodiesterase CpdA